MTTQLSVNEMTEKVIGCAFQVSGVLGCGFLEKVYHKALHHELVKSGLAVQYEHAIPVLYNGLVVGEYFADLIVERQVIIEVKAVKALDDIHVAQCLNYLKATNLIVCLLINLGQPKVQVKRIVNQFKD